MAKSVSVFVCGECGYESGKWLGKCPGCGSWNTLVEEAVVNRPAINPGAYVQPKQLKNVDLFPVRSMKTGIGELDRVLGGGIVPGSTILLSGDPGIGKSTILLQVSDVLAGSGRVLYVTGEESASQIKLRAERLGLSGEPFVLAQTDINVIETQVREMKPAFMVVDSVQTMSLPELGSAPGNVSQVREVTALLTRLAKQTGTAIFLVGHVTKEGAIAGPRVLEHMVDTVLYFEGDRHDALRILRTVKNRYGSTNEIGVFEMRDTGMQEVSDPSGMFLSRQNEVAGCAVTCAMEGTRPILVEIQALLATTAFGTPRRMAMGVDVGRLVLLLAVLEKKAGLKLYDKDVYVNVVGGLKLDERSTDLAVAMCIASCLSDRPLPSNTAILGEVGLTGEVRPVSRLDKRIAECMRLGFKRIIIPVSDHQEFNDVELLPVSGIAQAIAKLF